MFVILECIRRYVQKTSLCCYRWGLLEMIQHVAMKTKERLGWMPKTQLKEGVERIIVYFRKTLEQNKDIYHVKDPIGELGSIQTL